jgi:AraC-like DNA-binding protein
MADRQIAPAEEWPARLRGWSVIQLRTGTAYWLQPGSNIELVPGSVLVLAEGVQGSIRASQLSPADIRYFRVEPERLTGLVTLREQQFFKSAASRLEQASRLLVSLSPVAQKLSLISPSGHRNSLRNRLELLAIFFESFGDRLVDEEEVVEMPPSATQRLRQFLSDAPVADLLDLEFSWLAEKLCCTPRHLGRVFQDTVGMSFRQKQVEVRLTRARELLATTESKILDVALESGYQSISLFNSIFKRCHGMTPARWRQKSRGQKPATGARSKLRLSGIQPGDIGSG